MIFADVYGLICLLVYDHDLANALPTSVRQTDEDAERKAHRKCICRRAHDIEQSEYINLGTSAFSEPGVFTQDHLSDKWLQHADDLVGLRLQSRIRLVCGRHSRARP